MPDTSSLPPKLEDGLYEYKAYLQMELGRGKNTVASYAGDILAFARFAAERGRKSFREVDSDDLVLWMGEISKSEKPSTQSRKISALRSLSIHLVDSGVWAKNLSDMLARPKIRREVPEVLSADETDKLLSTPSGDKLEAVRDRAMLELMYGSGLRVSELCGLRESDIDPAERIIRVFGKGDKTRLVPVGDVALAAIAEYKKIRPQFLKRGNPAELFLTRRGKKLSRKTFWFNIKKYAVCAGIDKNVKPHILRHSFATHLLQNGANLMSIREMLGHSDLSTTQIYTRLLNEDICRQYAQKHPRSKMKVDFGE